MYGVKEIVVLLLINLLEYVIVFSIEKHFMYYDDHDDSKSVLM